jgi:galactitol PTS system EIIA component
MNIIDFLNPEAIFIQYEAKNSEEVIGVLGAKLYQLGYVKDNFIEAALEREADMPTGLPLGGEINAAIPHVDIEYVNRPALGFATLKEPVIFCNMVDKDEKVPVRLVIMLALEQPKSQIEMLQSVAGLLQQPAVITKLMAAKSPQEILEILA